MYIYTKILKKGLNDLISMISEGSCDTEEMESSVQLTGIHF